MFSCNHYQFLFYFTVTFIVNSCTSELPPPPPSLLLYSPGEPEYAEVVVRRVLDNLTLVCEVRGDSVPRVFVWNYVGQNVSGEHSPLTKEPQGPTTSSTLFIPDLTLADSGHYMCSAPPFSLTKYVIVQNRGDKCARGALSCGLRCVPALYVCDGRDDCAGAEDERGLHCLHQPCSRLDKLNCSSGRCISARSCCGSAPLCRQPACCDEHLHHNRIEGYMDVEYPALFEDRHAPDDYGFIQSTIYTVTACALIFMIAVVLLVSAICKMHMKRAALRSYTHHDNRRQMHYSSQLVSTPRRFPPCYETSRLLEQARHDADTHAPLAPLGGTESVSGESGAECEPPTQSNTFRLNRLSDMFSTQYTQVPTQCDVEMTDVRSTSLTNSPTRNQNRTPLDNYRSPTFCDLNTEFYFTNPETSDFGRDLNYLSNTPMEFFRRRQRTPSGLDRVIQQISQPRPLTLQLGRFQLSIPRFGRRNSSDQRPDTPNVAEINIDDLDFVRLNSGETYTLNGRTIRLLGGNFENYPVLPDEAATNPPAYNDAMRYKLYGPPPEYLSRDCLNENTAVADNVRSDNAVVNNIDEEARSNVEMPPRYEELNERSDNGNNVVTAANDDSVAPTNTVSVVDADNCVLNDNNNVARLVDTNEVITNTSNNNNDVIVETIDSVIDNLPAIDSDVNANGAVEC